MAEKRRVERRKYLAGRRRWDEDERSLRRVKIGEKVVIAGSLATLAYCGGQRLLGDDLPPPDMLSPELLNPPPASAPAGFETGRPDVDMERVKQAVEEARQKRDGNSGATKQMSKPETVGIYTPSGSSFVETVGTPETPEQKVEREKKYTKDVNAGLLVERSAEKILADKELAIKRIFEHMLKPQNEAYNNIPSEEVSRITQNEYYKAIEQAFLRRSMGNEAATPAETKKYWDGLSQSEKDALSRQILEARDIGEAFGMQAFNPIQEALNQYLRDHPELNQGSGRGR